MEKPNDDQVTPDGRITIGRRWITLIYVLWTIAFLIGAVVSAMNSLWVLSAVMGIFFVLSVLLLALMIRSRPKE